jgi:hypothetical protein
VTDPDHPDDRRYRGRSRVERMFGLLKRQRLIATRYEKTATSFLGCLNIAAARLWIKAFVNMIGTEEAPRRIRSGGNQPAYQSMINRRFKVVSPTLPICRPDQPILPLGGRKVFVTPTPRRGERESGWIQSDAASRNDRNLCR